MKRKKEIAKERKRQKEIVKTTKRDTTRKRESFEPVDVVVEFHFINSVLDCEHIFYHKIMIKITV